MNTPLATLLGLNIKPSVVLPDALTTWLVAKYGIQEVQKMAKILHNWEGTSGGSETDMHDEIHRALPDVEALEELLMSTLLLGFVAFLPKQDSHTVAAIVALSETPADSNHHTSPLKSNHSRPGKAPACPPTVIHRFAYHQRKHYRRH